MLRVMTLSASWITFSQIDRNSPQPRCTLAVEIRSPMETVPIAIVDIPGDDQERHLPGKWRAWIRSENAARLASAKRCHPGIPLSARPWNGQAKVRKRKNLKLVTSSRICTARPALAGFRRPCQLFGIAGPLPVAGIKKMVGGRI
jgi:hypothetical protein